MSAHNALASSEASLSFFETLKEYYEITKPRITFLVLITTFTGMWLTLKTVPPLLLTLYTLLGVGMASASSGTFNNFIDREIDAHMERTKTRPLPAGTIQPYQAIIWAVFLACGSFAILASQVNLLTASLALFTNFFYVVIYTIWLKRSSPLCTDIGGVAGALPPVLGVTAVTNEITPVAWALFAIMMLWQPPHFWAIALVKTEEYRKVGIPMLPVVKGEKVTKWHMLAYTIVLIPASLSLYWLDATGIFYLTVASLLGATYLYLTVDFMRRPFERKIALRLFFFSILYLCMLFVMMFIDCVS